MPFEVAPQFSVGARSGYVKVAPHFSVGGRLIRRRGGAFQRSLSSVSTAFVTDHVHRLSCLAPTTGDMFW